MEKTEVTIELYGIVYEFYKKVGQNVKKSPERVMEDALYKFAEMVAEKFSQ